MTKLLDKILLWIYRKAVPELKEGEVYFLGITNQEKRIEALGIQVGHQLCIPICRNEEEAHQYFDWLRESLGTLVMLTVRYCKVPLANVTSDYFFWSVTTANELRKEALRISGNVQT